MIEEVLKLVVKKANRLSSTSTFYKRLLLSRKHLRETLGNETNISLFRDKNCLEIKFMISFLHHLKRSLN